MTIVNHRVAIGIFYWRPDLLCKYNSPLFAAKRSCFSGGPLIGKDQVFSSDFCFVLYCCANYTWICIVDLPENPNLLKKELKVTQDEGIMLLKKQCRHHIIRDILNMENQLVCNVPAMLTFQLSSQLLRILIFENH